MMIKNVHYGERPNKIIVYRNGGKAIVEFPINVTEIPTEDGSQWLAETVYSIRTMDRENLEERIDANYAAWLEAAKNAVEPQAPNLTDVVDAINTLTDLILGGM